MIAKPRAKTTRRAPAVVCGGLMIVLSACAQATTAGAPEQPASASAASQGAAAPASRGAQATPAAAPAPKVMMADSPDGTEIAYEKTGAGPALLLLHGGGQTHKSWAEQGYVERLSKKFTVISMDMRGTGESGRPDTAEAYALDRVLEDVIAVADAAGAQRFHLWGFGHGASVGRYLAARSDRVISAVLVGADMGPTLSGVVKDAILAMRARWQPLLDQQKAGTLDLTKLSPGDRDAWKSGVAVSAMALGALAEYPPLEPADVKAPTLWLIGAADESGVEHAKAYEGKLAGTKVTFKAVSGLSYSDSFARIEPILAEVEPFLASTGAPSS